jgi:hypothetical protein
MEIYILVLFFEQFFTGGRVHNILVCPSCGHEQLSDKVIFFNNTNLFYDGDPFPNLPETVPLMTIL